MKKKYNYFLLDEKWLARLEEESDSLKIMSKRV